MADLPDRGSYDDLDEAIANSDAHYEVYDTETRQWCGAYTREEYDEAVARHRRKVLDRNPQV